MQQAETYNGWKNRTTWALHLWLTNDEDMYLAARDWIRENHAYTLDIWVRQAWAYFPTIMRTDVGADLSQVDWQSIADSLAE